VPRPPRTFAGASPHERDAHRAADGRVHGVDVESRQRRQSSSIPPLAQRWRSQSCTGQGGNSTTKRGAITSDGRIVAAKNAGEVRSYDLVIATASPRVLRRQRRPCAAVIDPNGGAVYALAADGHRNNNGTPSELVRLDATTLTVSGRIDLGVSRNRSLELSPDGKTLLIATALSGSGVIVVDVPTFTIRSHLQPAFRAQVAMFAPDGASIVLVGEQIQLYSPAGTPGALFTTPGTNGKRKRARARAGRSLWGRSPRRDGDDRSREQCDAGAPVDAGPDARGVRRQRLRRQPQRHDLQPRRHHRRRSRP
jgi:sugar lactone lactonase YvrE